MLARLVSLGAAIALVLGAGGAIVAACYDVPTPDCGFRCGPASACPDGYGCAGDGVCHRNGAPPGLVCAAVDAAPPIDAPIDAPADAPADVPDDAPDDAPPVTAAEIGRAAPASAR